MVNMNYEIIPAIMPQNIDDIESHAMLVRHDVETIQLDLMDGKYVPERTWPFGRSGTLYPDILSQELQLPFWEELDYELDLMVERPEENLDVWFRLGASRIIFHYASIHDLEKIIGIDPSIRNFVEIGIAITIHDDIEKIFPLIDGEYIDFVQVMGIKQVGFQGSPFEESSLTLIHTLVERYPDLIIAVDGGVSVATISRLAKAGAVRFVSGSGVFGSDIPAENIEQLYGEISE